jgi:signal transduction histidine kinase
MHGKSPDLDDLHAQAKRFRDFNANFPGAIFVYDLRPDGTDVVSYISEKCFEIWEVHAEDVLNDARPLWAIIAPEDVVIMRESIQKSAREMSPWHCRWRVITASHSEKWLEGWGQPICLANGTIRWNSMILDVSKYRKAEIALEISRERVASARHLESIGLLSSGIAHDFNNLLTVIAGHVELLKLKSGIDSKLEPILAQLSGAITRGSSLASNLLSYSRRHQSVEDVFDLKKFALQFEEFCKRTLSPRIKFSSFIDANLGSVLMDVGMLQSSLLNLILNSRDAVADEGEINLRYALQDTDDILVISVTDNGTGIPREVIEHVFEPFYTTKPVGKGTGLGLNMVRSFVDKYGGQVEIQSDIGKGAIVSLRFPMKKIRCESDLRTNLDSVSLGLRHEICERVLVVEDDPDILGVMIEILKIYGFDPIGMASADSALGYIESGAAVDALISDVMMPGALLGTGLVEKAKLLRPNLPIVLMSGYVDISRGSPLDVLGKYPDVAFVQKPARPEEIVTQLKRVLNKL